VRVAAAGARAPARTPGELSAAPAAPEPRVAAPLHAPSVTACPCPGRHVRCARQPHTLRFPSTSDHAETTASPTPSTPSPTPPAALTSYGHEDVIEASPPSPRNAPQPGQPLTPRQKNRQKPPRVDSVRDRDQSAAIANFAAVANFARASRQSASVSLDSRSIAAQSGTACRARRASMRPLADHPTYWSHHLLATVVAP